MHVYIFSDIKTLKKTVSYATNKHLYVHKVLVCKMHHRSTLAQDGGLLMVSSFYPSHRSSHHKNVTSRDTSGNRTVVDIVSDVPFYHEMLPNPTHWAYR